MKYSLVNDIKTEPFKGGIGVCIYCGATVVAKCGTKNIHHWAHLDLTECDKWWESEGIWHRKWKSYFPEEWQEIVHIADDNEKHIADLKTNYGVIVEFQNSPISREELMSREKFYQNMIWIVNGEKFKNFHILDKLPNVESENFKDYKFPKVEKKNKGRGYFLLSENPEYFKLKCYKYRNLTEILDKIEESYIGHHFLDWKNSHNVWLSATKPVFIDLGTNDLYRLLIDKEFNQQNLRVYKKEEIIKRIIKKEN